jgi:folate-binding protein YgfZ
MTSIVQSEIATPPTAALQATLAALLQGAGVIALDDVGWIRATGGDRVRWLNGMVTNSIQDLQLGAGNYNFLLSAQGRIQGDATVFAEADSLVLETSAAAVANVMKMLDHYIIMDDVELTDVSEGRSGVLVAGPQAAAVLGAMQLPTDELGPMAMKTMPWNGSDVTVIRAYSPLVPRFEIWAEAAVAAKLKDAACSAGAALCEEQSREWLRILEGTPRYGTDIRDRELPQETAQTRALHFAKGCYLGQEIVERIRSRGNVHRTFCGFLVKGALPGAGTVLEADGKQVGEITSAAAIPLPGKTVQLALGYARREALDRSAPLLYEGGVAVQVSLPYAGAVAD